MNRQNPWPHAMGNIILIAMTVSEIWDHCQNLLDIPRNCNFPEFKTVVFIFILHTYHNLKLSKNNSDLFRYYVHYFNKGTPF